MADYGRPRKRRRRAVKAKKKLIVGEKVEVRSIEDGFQGSWHSGVVISCQKQTRQVRYDNLLCDDGSEYLTESVDVSSVIDGIDRGLESMDYYRGRLRPSPLAMEFDTQAFHYGLCVDAYYNEAWWEGVIFDTNDGSEERKIFFPDLGDELVVGIENLRITHDWDEFTTEWRPRGNWLLLEIIKEYDNVVPVSVKQIWYDARESEKFEQIREWTYPVKNLWHDLIVKVIDDNLRIIADHFLNSFNLAEDMTENGEAMCYRDSTLNPESNLAYSGTPGPSLHDGFQNNDRTQISKARLNVVDELAENVGFAERFPDASSSSRSFLHSDDQDPCEQPKALSVVPSSPKELTCSYVHSSYEGRPCSDSGDPEWKPRRKPPRSSKKWHVHVVSEPEFCPHSITDYALSKHAGHILTRKLQKHLAYLGWKIEFTRDKGFRQIRYMSPDGKTYYQLRKVCELLGPVAESSTPPPGAQASTRQSPGHLNCHLLPDYVEPERCPEAVVLHSEHIDNMALSDYVEPQYCSEAAVQVHAGKMEKRPLIDDVEAEYCPEAVLEYLRFRNMNGSRKKEGSGELLWKARKHLKFMGWEFWIKIKRKGTEEWRYRPPSGGKIYYSLQTACKGFIRDSGLIDRLLEYGLVKDVISGWQAKSQSGGELSIFDSEFRGSAVTKDQPIKHMKLRKLRKGRHRKICKRKRKVMSRSMTSSFQSDIQHQPHSADDGFTNGLKNDGKTSPIRRLKITFSSKKLKISGASRKMRKNPGGNVRTRVLRSTKRARQLVTSNITQQSPRTVLSWLIDNNVVLPRAKVHYGSRKDHHSLAEGRITRDGIKCNCCQKVFTLSGFEAHAGGIYRRPAANIYLEDGRSLVDCQMQMLRNNMMSVSGNPQGRKKRRNQLENWNDHICSICQYGGKLILCDRCPSSFHMSCLNLQDLPEGDWFCPLCCCGICGESCFDENPEQLVDRSILCCHQCEHQYHFSCLRNRGMVKLDLDRSENWFCCRTCEKVYWGLQKLLGKPILVGHDNLTWTLVRPMQYDRDNLDESEMEAMAENYCKLNVALEVMHECFEPVIERQTRRDLVEDVIFSKGSKLNRLNFRGFYTVLLERNDELITAATVRVYGEKVAEVPLVGTRFQYRRLGMCRILMRELEKNLNEIGVEKLILPAVPSVLNAWTSSFGFAQMTHSQRSELLSYTFLDFQGTIMCHKFLRKPPSSESLTLRGVHGELDKKFEGTDGNIIDVDGNSGISEVSQEEQTDGFEIVGQAPVVNTTEGSGSDTCTNPNPTVPLVPESNVQLCEPSNIRRSPESSIELPDQKKPDGAKKSEGLKSYKRKKMVDRPPLPQADYPNVKVSCM